MKRVGFVLLALGLAIGLAWKFAGREREPTAAPSPSQASASSNVQSNRLSLAEPSATAEPESEAASAIGGAKDEPQRQAVDGPTRLDEILLVGELLGMRSPEGSVVLIDARGTLRKGTINGTAFEVPGLERGTWRAVVRSEGCASLDVDVVLDGKRSVERRNF